MYEDFYAILIHLDGSQGDNRRMRSGLVALCNEYQWVLVARHPDIVRFSGSQAAIDEFGDPPHFGVDIPDAEQVGDTAIVCPLRDKALMANEVRKWAKTYGYNRTLKGQVCN